MGSGTLQQAGLFLVRAIFDFYIVLLLLRLILQYLRVDFYNPVTQFIVKCTNPVVIPLRRIIPGYWGIDFGTVLMIILFGFIKTFCIAYLTFHRMPLPLGLAIWALGDLIKLTINVFFYALFISILLSWIQGGTYSAVASIVFRLTEPLLKPFRRIIPLIAGFDITPIPVMMGLQLLIIVLATPLIQMGFQLALR